MKRRLMFMRHAKSSWAEANMDDYDRPLNQRGRTAAPLMGDWMLRNACIPDAILSSTATRAAETTQLIVDKINYQGNLCWSRGLYLASPATILKTICELAEGETSLMVVAHNPGLEQLVSAMSGQYRDFPTAAIAIFSVELMHWSELLEKADSLEWHMEHYVTPKSLGAENSD